MAKLTCRCLNVALHCKDERWAPVAGERVVPTGHRLRQRTLHEVELAVAGVTAVSYEDNENHVTRLHPTGTPDPPSVGGSGGLDVAELQQL